MSKKYFIPKLPELPKIYVQFGDDGHLYPVDDQKAAEELWKKQLRIIAGEKTFSKDCYAWVKNRNK